MRSLRIFGLPCNHSRIFQVHFGDLAGDKADALLPSLASSIPQLEYGHWDRNKSGFLVGVYRIDLHWISMHITVAHVKTLK